MKLIETRSRTLKDPFYVLALLEICAITDAIVFLFSLGYLKSNLRVSLLFSEWAEEQQEKRLVDVFGRLRRNKIKGSGKEKAK